MAGQNDCATFYLRINARLFINSALVLHHTAPHGRGLMTDISLCRMAKAEPGSAEHASPAPCSKLAAES